MVADRAFDMHVLALINGYVQRSDPVSVAVAAAAVCAAVRQQLVQGLERLALARQQQRLREEVSGSSANTAAH